MAVAVIINLRFTFPITYHDSLQGLLAGRGTGTATLEVKLIQQIASSREAVLHAIFLDLHKAYDAFDRSSCLGVLELYGVGTRSLHLLQRYWEKLNMVAQVEGGGGYYGSPFHGKRGFYQGNPLSSTIFNVVVDAVVCHWGSLVVAEQEGGDSSCDKGDRAQTAGRKIRDRDDGR